MRPLPLPDDAEFVTTLGEDLLVSLEQMAELIGIFYPLISTTSKPEKRFLR